MIPARELATRAVRRLLHDQPMSEAKVRFAWQSAVGSAMARATSVRLDSSGTLEVSADSDAWRQEVVRAAGVVAGRMADLLGTGQITRIVVTTKRQTE